MAQFPDCIQQFLQQRHILTLCVHNPEKVWAANCFYVFDVKTAAFYILSELKTEHAKIMLESPQVVGTVNVDTTVVSHIQGIQYQATAVLLSGKTMHTAYQQYYARFPFAQALPAPVWQLDLTYVKFTDNTKGFGNKIVWRKAAR
jgi:uncharacterized protein YhbP (UPF0306 family)